MPVNVTMPFNVVHPLIENVVLLMSMLVSAVGACENPSFDAQFQRMLIF